MEQGASSRGVKYFPPLVRSHRALHARGNISEGFLAQPPDEQRLRLSAELPHERGNRLLNQASGTFDRTRTREHRFAQCPINVAQPDSLRRPRQDPSTSVPRSGADQGCFPKAGHRPSHHHRIGHEARCQLFGSGGLAFPFRDLEQGMERDRKAAVSFHVTIIVTNSSSVKRSRRPQPGPNRAPLLHRPVIASSASEAQSNPQRLG